MGDTRDRDLLRDGRLLQPPLLLDGLAPGPHVCHSHLPIPPSSHSGLDICSPHQPFHISIFQTEGEILIKVTKQDWDIYKVQFDILVHIKLIYK